MRVRVRVLFLTIAQTRTVTLFQDVAHIRYARTISFGHIDFGGNLWDWIWGEIFGAWAFAKRPYAKRPCNGFGA